MPKHSRRSSWRSPRSSATNEGLLSRLFTATGGSYAALDGPAVAMAQRDDHELILRNTRWVNDAARSRAVIVGRNGNSADNTPHTGTLTVQ